MKTGPGPHPIETKEGWLLIYHGVWCSCNGYIYSAGGALLDLDKPWKVIARTKDYLMYPTELYERVGDVPERAVPELRHDRARRQDPPLLRLRRHLHLHGRGEACRRHGVRQGAQLQGLESVWRVAGVFQPGPGTPSAPPPVHWEPAFHARTRDTSPSVRERKLLHYRGCY